MSANLARKLVDTAARHPEAIALKLDDAALNYALLDAGSARVAGMLRERGIGPGDRVGIMLPNVPYFPVVYYGVLRAGAVVVPMNVLLKAREVAFYLGDPEARLVFAWHGFLDDAQAGADEAGVPCVAVEPGGFEQLLAAAPAADAVAERDEQDTAVILYTSGTTGTPKGAELTHANLARNVEVTLSDLIDVGVDDVVLGALPLFHSFGQTCSMNACVAAGGTLSLLPRFDPGKALEIIQRDRVTIFEGVPTMYAAMLNHPGREDYDLSSLRLCASGGAALPAEVRRSFEATFGCEVLEGYGLSETSPVASFNHPGDTCPESIGKPIRGVEMRVVDDEGNDVPVGEPGEIVIRGHNVMKGYWRKPEATAAALRDGWLHTGDVARVNEDGFFFIVDRKKDMIIRGGYNVYPREIEEVLYEHPAVAEAAVVGVPHPELGEEVGAAVALRAGAAASEEELRAFVKERVAAYKYPRHVWFVDELPKGPTGKILKREIAPPPAVAEGGAAA